MSAPTPQDEFVLRLVEEYTKPLRDRIAALESEVKNLKFHARPSGEPQ